MAVVSLVSGTHRSQARRLHSAEIRFAIAGYMDTERPPVRQPWRVTTWNCSLNPVNA